MCGFVGIFGIEEGKARSLRKTLLAMSRKIRHRGPDWSGVFAGKRALISHERLAIIGVGAVGRVERRGHAFHLDADVRDLRGLTGVQDQRRG